MNVSNYSQKLDALIVIRDEIIKKIKTVAAFKKVSGNYSDFANNETDLPLVVVLYKSADSPNVRENANVTAYFDIVIKDKAENELDDVSNAKAIMALFEDYTLGGKCVGMIPHFPEIYYNTSGETATVQTVIRLDVEI